ncbi:MAG: DUF2808 domain-containing protein [Prochloraceae cyanobacterium]|nr:DUF2808 domain-containing protein [Prochloraceae cyanobacterium]
MNFLVRYSPVFVVSAAVVLIQPQAILALSAEQVNNIAKKVSVRIDGKNTGSGVIIAREGDTYIAITNWHVVDRTGQYQIQTYDGQSHSISYDRVRKLTGADLAVVYFTSGKEYPIAARGDSDRLIEGQRIYYAGYPGSMRVGSRTYRFYSENIIGFLLDSDIQDGYELIYSGEAIPGMSGSPILDEQGRLIAIYGRADIDNVTGSPSLYGILINTAEKLANRAGIKFNTSVATSSPPSRPTPTPTPTPQLPHNWDSSRLNNRQFFTGSLKLEEYLSTQDRRNVRGAIYYFTIDLPENAGAPLQKIVFQQTDGDEFLLQRYREEKAIAFEGTRENRGKPISLSKDSIIVDRDNRTVTIMFSPPISPGKKITIGLRPIATPRVEGVFILRVTVFPPAGDRYKRILGAARLHFYGGVD